MKTTPTSSTRRDLGRDAVEVAALEHDLGQPGVQGVDARQCGARALFSVTSYQDLHSPAASVGTTSHRQTVIPPASVGQVIPVSAPPRVRDRLRAAPDGPVPVIHRGRDAVYVEIGGLCVGVVGARATGVPCALRSRIDDLRLPSGALPGERAHLRHGELHLDDRPVRIGRLVDVSVPS